jgi:phosphoglycerol transferase MdoB-like AlkP superfamily enzyme
LFEEANRVLRDTEDPFFAIVHLSGNHRPYTIPADNRGFTPETIDDELAIENGFDKQDGYNSFRFMDHSLGFFMRLAGNEAYFDNTIFVLTADNGEIGKVPGPLHVEEASRISNHHAPFVIFSPRLESEPQRIEAIATQMDLLPTIAGAAGVPATNIALGRNMLDPRFADGFAFIHRRWGTGSELVILDDEYMYTSKGGVQPPVLEKFDAANQEWRVIANEPDQAASMETYAESFYQTAKYLMFGDNR